MKGVINIYKWWLQSCMHETSVKHAHMKFKLKFQLCVTNLWLNKIDENSDNTSKTKLTPLFFPCTM